MTNPDATIDDRVSVQFYGDPGLIGDISEALTTAINRSSNAYVAGTSSRIYYTRKGESGLNHTIQIKVCPPMLPEPNHIHYLTKQ